MTRIRYTTILIFISVLLTGCGGTPVPEHVPASEVVTLRYMIWDKNQEPAYKQIIDRFTAENPTVKIDMQVVPWGSYWEKLMTEISGGSAPDVFWGYIPRVPSLAERKALLSLTSYIERDHFKLDSFNSSLVQGFAYKGEQYGIPKDWDALGVFYNKDLLRKAGYKQFPEGLSWNPEDGGSLVKFLQKLTLDVNGKHPDESGFDPHNIVKYGFNYTDRGEWDPGDLAGFAASNGTSILTDGQFKPNGRLLETMQFLHDLVFKYYVSPDYSKVKMAGSDQLFLSGQIALWITGSWQMVPVKQKALFDWGIEPFPTGPHNKRVVRINGLADHIYANSVHKEEAWKFVQFINSQEGQDILGKTGTVFPMNPASIQSFVEYYRNLGVDPAVFVNEFHGGTVTMPVTKNYLEWVQIWFKQMGLIFSGEMDLRSGLQKLAKDGNPIASR